MVGEMILTMVSLGFGAGFGWMARHRADSRVDAILGGVLAFLLLSNAAVCGLRMIGGLHG